MKTQMAPRILVLLGAVAFVLTAGPRLLGNEFTIPEGTTVKVKLLKSIDLKAVEPGSILDASLADPLMVGLRMIAPSGAAAKVEVVHREGATEPDGKSMIALKLCDLDINGRNYAVSSNSRNLKGKEKKTVEGENGGRLGVMVGNVFTGDNKSHGGGAGVEMGMGKPPIKTTEVFVPNKTNLSFKLKAPVLLD